MKKAFYRIFSLVLAIVVLITALSGCTGGIVEADASDYLTKGEWFNYFISEVDLSYSSKISLDLDSESEYYDAVMSIVDNEIIDEENAVKDLDKIVTKDVVAYTCVNYLPTAYQVVGKTDYKFKDEKKITDVNAAKVAVNVGIVEAKSKTKFGAEDYVSAEDCEKAINTMIDHLATYEFEENNTKFIYNDNVYETNDDVEVESYKISDFNDYTDDDSSITDVSFSGLKNDNEPEISNCANEKDEIVVWVPELSYITNKEAYRVGNIVKFNVFELDIPRKSLDICYIKITEEPTKGRSPKGISAYRIKGTLPTTNETIKCIEKGQKGRSKAESIKLIPDGTDYKFGPVKIKDGSINFKYTTKSSKTMDLDNGRSDKTDPTLSANIDLDITISDIIMAYSGFDTIFTDSMYGKPNANLTFSYKTKVNGKLTIPETRLAPYNNGNGKFPSNLNRSRFTTGKGAEDIKICKCKVSFYGINATLRIGLQVKVDGTVKVTVEKDSSTNYVIKKGGISTTQTSKKNAELKAEVNLYVGVEMKGDISLGGFPKTIIADCRVGAGFNAVVTGNVYIMNNSTTTTEYSKKTDTNISGTQLKYYSKFDTKLKYCIGAKCQFKIYAGGFEGDSIIKYVIKLFNKDFNGLYKEQALALGQFHFEDGKVVKQCTRVEGDDEKIECTAGDKFDISAYNVVINDDMPAYFYITEIPCKPKNLEKINNGLKVSAATGTNRKKICNVTYFSDEHKVEIDPVSQGTCLVTISTPHKKFNLSVAVIVNKNTKTGYDVQISDLSGSSPNYLSV